MLREQAFIFLRLDVTNVSRFKEKYILATTSNKQILVWYSMFYYLDVNSFGFSVKIKILG